MEDITPDILTYILSTMNERSKYETLYNLLFVSKVLYHIVSKRITHVWNLKVFHYTNIIGMKYCSRVRLKVPYSHIRCEYNFIQNIVVKYGDTKDIVELDYDVYGINYTHLIEVLENKNIQRSLERIKINRFWETTRRYKDSSLIFYHKVYDLLLQCGNLKEIVWYFEIPVKDERTGLENFELYNTCDPKNYDFCIVYQYGLDYESDVWIQYPMIHITPRKYYEIEKCLYDCYFKIDSELFKNFDDNVIESYFDIWLTPEHSYKTLIEMGMIYNRDLACDEEICEVE